MVDRMAELAAVADLFEIRADLRPRPRPAHHPARAHAARSSSPAAPVSEGGPLGRRRPAPPPHPARGRQARLRLRGRRAAQRLHRRDGGEGRARGSIVSHHDLEGTPDDLDAPLPRDGGRGRRHREDRGHAAVDRRRGAPARASRRAWRDDGGPPLIALAMGPLGIAHARAWPAATARPSPSPPPPRARRPRPASSRRRVMADLYRVRNVTPETQVYGVLGHGRAAQPVARPAQPRLRGARPRRRLRAPAGGGARAVHARRCPRSACPASA